MKNENFKVNKTMKKIKSENTYKDALSMIFDDYSINVLTGEKEKSYDPFINPVNRSVFSRIINHNKSIIFYGNAGCGVGFISKSLYLYAKEINNQYLFIDCSDLDETSLFKKLESLSNEPLIISCHTEDVFLEKMVGFFRLNPKYDMKTIFIKNKKIKILGSLT